MTDRELCRKCIHSYFSSYAHFQYCNYLDDTGRKRPHDGDSCYGFEAWDGKKKRRRRMPGKRPGRTNGSTLNETSVQKAAEAVQRAEDKMLRKTAARIRNKMFDEMTMWAQHMGDNVNRIV